MRDRLVVGDGSLARAVIEKLADESDRLSVVTGTERQASALREQGIEAEALAVTDPAVLSARFDPEIVFVAADDPEVTGAVRTAFPDAYVLAYGSTERLGDVADRVVDPVGTVTDAVLDRIGPRGRRAGRLRGVLRGLDSLAIVTHDSPDPDAIASGTALATLATSVGCRTTVLYSGQIAHHENQALVNLLDLDLQAFEGPAALTEYDGVALVDHSRPGVNDQLPPETPIDIVIDHHPANGPVAAEFLDLRSEVGATSTLLVEYLDEFDVPVPEPVATALLFGILVDTDEFVRGVSPLDFEAAAWLVPHAEFDRVERIESPSISASALETLAAAIQNRTTEDGFVVSWAGSVPDRTAIAQAADRLLELDGATTAVVTGVADGTVHVSGRARGGFDVGQLLRDAFQAVGSAGGHADMAGAQIDPKALAGWDGGEPDPAGVRNAVTELLRGALETSHAAATDR